MVGTLAVSTVGKGQGITEYTLDWLSDASGDVSANTFDMKRGYIEAIRFKPDGGGTVPTTLYDVTLIDSDSFDLATALGANLSATVTTRSKPLVNTSGPVWFEGGSVDLVVAAAGNAKGGIITVWVFG